MFWLWIVLLGLAACVVVLIVAWRPLRHWGATVQAERARELFLLQRELIQGQFLSAAAGTGKPRGLHWVECAFDGGLEFARDRVSRQVIALVQVTIRFEAVEGSDMEGLPAVANLRNASAVFFFFRGQWRTAGKAVFNLNPGEALQHFRNQYEVLHPDDRRPLSPSEPSLNGRAEIPADPRLP
jgi:hypothetical protein